VLCRLQGLAEVTLKFSARIESRSQERAAFC
jgi:hypothetical protein